MDDVARNPSEPKAGVSRRYVVAAATAAFALAGAVLPMPAPAQAAEITPAPTRKPVVLSFTVAALRQLGGYKAVAIDDRTTVVGELVGDGGAVTSGTIHGSGTVLSLPQRGDNSHASFTTQLLSFSDGSDTITATGLLRHDGTGTFTITGGSGQYSGATGSYTAVLHPNTGGSGTGTLTITLN
ncbi:allene oxide cyclase barrel-like domain-containing protein [Subtercola frigoramans]|uniref:Allene oxide cyclase barrel-like domain-containing protein n=1 Tax=Subtercola frigoramans TaxID=120298 RepID=A0ABS2L4F2_9MICO|nr:hypothetical protein [Subtercola frigoramans]MBM7471909.1 hypothetical protein [Subtercola frigoramans]